MQYRNIERLEYPFWKEVKDNYFGVSDGWNKGGVEEAAWKALREA